MAALLEIDGLEISFGGVKALHGVGFTLAAGEILAIIGPNGAGKTTVFNCISGLYRPQAGSIRMEGRELVGRKPHQVAAAGIARTFQNIELFSFMSTMDNLLLGRHQYIRTGLLSGMAMLGPRSPAARQEMKHRERVEEIIDFLDLQAARNQMVGSLPYGTQKVVELGRALAMEPRVLLLDEPAAGMNLEEKQDLRIWIQDISRQFGIAVLLIEHDMQFVGELADRVIAINYGQNIAEGTPDEVRAHPEVLRAYLGDDAPVALAEAQPAGAGAATGTEALLRLENVDTFYGPIQALRGASLEVTEGSILAILGANGAGKTTLLKTVMGLLEDQPDKGNIYFEGRPIHGRETEDIARRGIAYVPEGREVFHELTVMENLRAGAYTRRDDSAPDLQRMFEYFPRLLERRDQWAGTLSGGEQQMLAIARALMSRPRLMLLDEPSLGLSPLLVQEIFEILRRINADGTTLLLVEQNARMALSTAHRALVMEGGRFVLDGTAAEVAADPDVQEFYLGVAGGESAAPLKRYRRKKRWR